MLAMKDKAIVGVCLALLFTFSSLAPLAAQSLTSSAAGMSCCRSKGKSCCCRKDHNQEPAISGRACPNDCGHVTPAGVTVAQYVLLRARTSVPAAEVSSQLQVLISSAQTLLLSPNLRQRPPPSLRSA